MRLEVGEVGGGGGLSELGARRHVPGRHRDRDRGGGQDVNPWQPLQQGCSTRFVCATMRCTGWPLDTGGWPHEAGGRCTSGEQCTVEGGAWGEGHLNVVFSCGRVLPGSSCVPTLDVLFT